MRIRRYLLRGRFFRSSPPTAHPSIALHVPPSSPAPRTSQPPPLIPSPFRLTSPCPNPPRPSPPLLPRPQRSGPLLLSHPRRSPPLRRPQTLSHRPPPSERQHPLTRLRNQAMAQTPGPIPIPIPTSGSISIPSPRPIANPRPVMRHPPPHRSRPHNPAGARTRKHADT